MATVTAQGITPTTLAEYGAALGVVWRNALGDDLSLDTETPQAPNLSLIHISEPTRPY